MKPLLVLAALLSLSSCNFAPYIKSDTVKNAATTNGPVYITGFSFTTANNPTLSTQVNGTIDNTQNTISLVVPYKVFDNSMALIPTISTTTGATLNLSGAKSFASAITYQVTSADGSATRSYTVTATADPNTIAYLNVSSPFYIASGSTTTTAITTYTISTATALTYNLVVPAATYSSISSDKIGFSTVSIPTNAVYTTTDILNLRSGATTPYNVTITSEDGSYTKKYTISLAAATSSNSGIGITADAYTQESYVTSVAYSATSANSILTGNTVSVPLPDPAYTFGWSYDSQYSTSTEAATPTTVSKDALTLATGFTSLNQTVYNNGQYFTFSGNGIHFYVNDSQAQAYTFVSAFSSNDSSIKYLLTAPTQILSYGAQFQSQGTLTLSPTYTNSASPTADASLPVTTGFTSPESYYVTLTTATAATITHSLSEYGEDNQTHSVATFSFNYPNGTTTSATGSVTSTAMELLFYGTGVTNYTELASYYTFKTITITTSSSTSTISGITTSPSLVSSYTNSGNTLILTMVYSAPTASSSTAFTPCPKQVGIAAAFTVTSQAGSATTYALTLQ